MRRLVLTLLAVPAVALAAASEKTSAETGPRNPFWPIGYEGKREAITAEIRVAPRRQEEIQREREAAKAAAEAAEESKRKAAEEAKRKAAEEAEKAKIITEEHWVRARKALQIGGRVKVRTEDGAEERSSAIINGNTYVDGDLVSFNHGRNRFTWRVTGLTDGGGKLKLVRVRARNLDEAAAPKRPAAAKKTGDSADKAPEDGKTGKGDK